MNVLIKTCTTMNRRSRLWYIVSVILLAMAIIVGVAYLRYAAGFAVFREPVHDPAAVQSQPDSANESYAVLPVTEGYIIGLCTEPEYKDGRLYINAYNDTSSSIWYLVRVYDDGSLIGESGLLYQGELVESVQLSKVVTKGQELTVKTIAYTPEEYHSEGVATILCRVRAE